MKNVAFFHRKQINFHFYIKEICLKNYFFREILHVFLDVKMNKNIKKWFSQMNGLRFFWTKTKHLFSTLLLVFWSWFLRKREDSIAEKKGGGWKIGPLILSKIKVFWRFLSFLENPYRRISKENEKMTSSCNP